MDYSLTNIRWLRVIGAALLVIALSLLIVIAISAAYAFILAFEARGKPDQAAIGHFAASVSRWLIPLLEMSLTFFASAVVARRGDSTVTIEGLIVGILVGLLSLGVTLVFVHHLGLYSPIYFFITVGLGWLGSIVRKKKNTV